LQAQYVFLFIGLTRIIDMGTGLNSQIIGTSTFWRFEFVSGLILLLLLMPLTYVLTRHLGVIGPGISNLVAFTVYNGIRFGFLLRKFNMQPFTRETGLAILAAAVCFAVCYFLFQDQSGLLWIALRSLTYITLFMLLIVYLKLTPDLMPVLATVRRRLGMQR
jgi:hypothetical protein